MIHNSRSRAGLLLAGWMVMSLSMAARAEDPPLDDPAALKSALATTLPQTERDHLSPAAAVKYLASLSDENLYLDAPVLTAAGYDVNSSPGTVHLNLNNLTLAAALDQLTQSLSTPKAPLKWSTDDGVIVISTAGDKKLAALASARQKSANEDAYKDDRVIEDLPFNDVSVNEAIKVLRDNSLNVYVHFDALTDAGIDGNTRLTVPMKRVHPATAITMLTRELAGASAALTFEARNGVWVITSHDDIVWQDKVWMLNVQAAEDQESANKLATVIDEIHFDAQPLVDALETLGKQGEVTFKPDWAMLAKAEIDEKTPVTFHATHVKLSTAIDFLLTDAADKHHLLYTAKDSTIAVTYKPEPVKTPVTKPTTRPTTK